MVVSPPVDHENDDPFNPAAPPAAIVVRFVMVTLDESVCVVTPPSQVELSNVIGKFPEKVHPVVALICKVLEPVNALERVIVCDVAENLTVYQVIPSVFSPALPLILNVDVPTETVPAV